MDQEASDACCPCRPAVCDPCCPAAVIYCDYISASLTKCGFAEFGTPSSPPKKYRTKAQTGGLTNSCDFGGPNEQTDASFWYGDITYARGSCAITDTRYLRVGVTLGTDVGNCFGVRDFAGEKADDLSGGDSKGCYMWATDCATVTLYALQGCCTGTGTIVSTTVKTYADNSCPPFGCEDGTVTGPTVTVTLSNEYTTAHLIADTISALPSYPGTFSTSGSCSSYRNLSSDELTYSLRRFKYKFILPDLTGIECYKITWLEGATPREYEWNGTDTETPVYGPVEEPASNGSVFINTIVFDCVCA